LTGESIFDEDDAESKSACSEGGNRSPFSFFLDAGRGKVEEGTC